MDSYKESIFEPLEYYINYGKETHNRNVSEHFESLVKKSGVDENQNKATVKKYYDTKKQIELLKKKITRNKIFRALSIVASVILFLITVPISQNFSDALKVILPLLALALGIFVIILTFRLTKKKLAALSEALKKQESAALKLLSEAEAQMAPLNALFSDSDTFTLIEKTLPQTKFDKQFLFENLEDLKNGYGFNGIFGNKSSVLDVVSGKLYKNPFLFERALNEEVGSHTYTGTLVISWTEYGRDSKGRTVRRRRTQTLVATVTKPKPVYNVTTLLSYGSQAAPDLCFSRENRHYEDFSEKQVEREVRRGARKLKKKAEKALSAGKSFTEMSNTRFDTLFDASNRDNEQQFRIMFTPLAQREMIDLIRSEAGYGDDFDFFKRKKLNVIRSEHSQSWECI